MGERNPGSGRKCWVGRTRKRTRPDLNGNLIYAKSSQQPCATGSNMSPGFRRESRQAGSGCFSARQIGVRPSTLHQMTTTEGCSVGTVTICLNRVHLRLPDVSPSWILTLASRHHRGCPVPLNPGSTPASGNPKSQSLSRFTSPSHDRRTLCVVARAHRTASTARRRAPRSSRFELDTKT